MIVTTQFWFGFLTGVGSISAAITLLGVLIYLAKDEQ